ncbi:MAG: ATP-dependent DNA helicase RecG [Chloroflexota bacterium]
MSKSFQRLSSVLKLEAQQGYQNKAVVGGIYQFITYWVNQARDEVVDEVDKAFIEQTADALSDYHRLPGHAARKQIVDRLREKLEERRLRDPSPVVAEPKSEPPPAPTPPRPITESSEKLPPSPPPPPSDAKKTLDKPKKKVHKGPHKRSEPHSTQEKKPTEPEPDPEGLAQSIETIRGIGPKTAEQLDRIGIRTIEDLLYVYPRRYDDYTQMKPISRLEYGETVTLIGTVWEVRARKSRNNSIIVQAVISDGTGKITASWYNQPWLTQKLKSGLRVVLAGKVEQYLGRKVFNSPQWELLSMDALRTGSIVPVYPLTQGLSGYKLRQIMRNTVPYWTKRIADPLPESIRQQQRLSKLRTALQQIHLPESFDHLVAARRRLIFDEMFLLQLGMLGQRREWVSNPGHSLEIDRGKVNQFIESLPYTLTAAQQRVVTELLDDIQQARPMNRLLQGDVGAGKTVVAAAAMVAAVSAGTQATLMAPTEILAEQHYQGLKKLLNPLGITVYILTGRVSAVDRREAYAAMASGEAHIVVGTHALIQEEVDFHNLGLAIIDEQHRFGVDQRKALRDKGPLIQRDQITPHLLVMSATPIPRSLALSVFGDLDLSVIDEMPPGRQEIDTHWLRPPQRERCYRFVRGQIEKGRQAYIICPLVEESEKIEAASAVEEYERLSIEIFPDLRLGLVHGKLRGDEKEAVMSRFYDGELDILVSTTVIEVGVDVPNSTVMMIENANRFGLAQLHQLRGRVGRGQHKSYCLLVADNTTQDSEERLRALEETNDGFQLAEKDLELRGPGEFFGKRQSGIPELKLASYSDTDMLISAREEAKKLFETDPHLEQEENQLLRQSVARFWENAADIS